MIDRRALFTSLAESQPAPDDTASISGISTAMLVSAWLGRGPARFEGDDRAQLDALCRQIDVRRKVSAAYDEGWKRREPEVAAPDAVVSGLAAVLLGNAATIDQPEPLVARAQRAGVEHDPGGVNDGWALKCVNSALKAIDLRPDAPHAPELRAWAMERLDAIASPWSAA